jgi:membrane-associated PAP2 superfamily phosphatase
MISVVPFYHTLWHHLWYDYLYIGAAVVVVTGMALLLVYGVSCFKGRYYSSPNTVFREKILSLATEVLRYRLDR